MGCYKLISFVAELQIDSLCGGLQIDSLCVRGYKLIPSVAEEGRVWPPWGKNKKKRPPETDGQFFFSGPEKNVPVDPKGRFLCWD